MTDRISPALLSDAIVVSDPGKAVGIVARDEPLAQGSAPRTVTDQQAVQWAMSLQRDGQSKQAEVIYRQILAQQPRQSDALHLLGLMMFQRGRLDMAVDLVRRAIDARPNFATYYSNLGVILRARGEQDAALKAYQAALRLAGDSAELHNNLAVMHDELGQAEIALQHAWLALSLDPNDAPAHNNLANILRRQGRLFESVAQLQAALKIKSQYPDAWFNFGLTLEELGEYKQALQCYDNAIKLDDKHRNALRYRALLQLKLGDFAAGWAGYELRQRGFNAPPSSPLWQGQPIAGNTLLLLAEHGLGDAIMFSRYCLLAAKVSGARLIAQCDPSLRDLFGAIGAVSQWFDRREIVPAHDFHLSLHSLPWLLKTTAQTIPAPYSYLRAPANRVQQLDLRIGADLPAGRKVGIVWSGAPQAARADSRSCPFSYFLQLLQVPDLQLISLQSGEAAAQWLDAHAPARMRAMNLRCRDHADLAMVIAQLDLVIAVDSSIAHLAGALGKPVYLLLTKLADWRWQLERGDSPWYPSMRLLRQEHVGDWGGVFARLINELRHEGASVKSSA